jgi:predicted dehydrogenase
MRGLVVGLGSIGRRHARNWAALGLGDVWVARQTERPLAEPLGVDARFFATLDEALAHGPDVVLVTNPTSLHVETARKAIVAGAHVLIEKPLGHTLDGVPELIAEARHAQRVLLVGYQLRFSPGLARLRELLHGGAVGQAAYVRAEVGEYLPDWHPWEDYRQSYSGRRDLGGGPLLTFSHEFDAVCWLLGVPQRISGVGVRSGSLEIDTDDVFDATLQFESGVIASVHVDYLRRATQRSVEVIGAEGVLRWEYDTHQVVRYAPATREWRIEEGDPNFTRNDLFLAELRHLAACVRGEAEPLIDGQQGAAVLAICLAAQQAAVEERTVDLASMPEPVSTWLSSLRPR